MIKETIIENEYASMWYYPESKIIYHVIKKYAFGKHLQDLLLKGTELVESRGATKWLSDDRNNNAISLSDSEWMDNNWRPTTVKNGWKYWALVQPEKLAGQMNMKKHTKISEDSGIIVKTFNGPDEAMKWLIEQ